MVFGAGLGAAATSFSIATLTGVHPSEAGLASGLNNTFEAIFEALGTAIMASVAGTHTNGLIESGTAPRRAINDGFGLAFAVAFPALGLLASIALRPAERRARAARRVPATLLETAAKQELA